MDQKELETLIKQYQKSYYDGNEEISDSEFDKLWDELSERFPDSEVLKAVGEDSVTGTKRKHLMVVGSQDKFNTVEGLHKWLNNESIMFPVFMEPKYDGNGIGVIYENGNLKYAITRGNGYEGEDVTKAAIASHKFPLHNVLWTSPEKNADPIPFNGEVRGEIIIARDIFNSKYSQFKNPRNFTAGALKNEEFTDYQDFDFFMYDVMSSDGNFATERGKLNFLSENGFQTTLWKIAYDVEDILEYRDGINPKFYPFNIDGIVLKQNIIDLRDLSELRPKKQHAFKWKDEGETTILKDVEWTLSGRTMTPVAILEPVEIDGSTVQRANLCNPNLINDLGIKIGDEVEVVKRGMIIPKVEKVTRTFDDSVAINIPVVCPECGSPLINIGTRLYCSNDNCISVLSHRITKWIKKLDVKNFGPALIEWLVKQKYVTSLIDIYNPEVHKKMKDEWGLNGEKAYKNLLAKKDIPLAKVVAGFDIKGLGEELIQPLVDQGFNTIDKLLNISQDELCSVKGWSETRALIFISEIKPIEGEIRAMFDLVGDKKAPIAKVVKENILNGTHICVTGKLYSYTRNQVEDAINSVGATMDKQVTRNTDYLVTNDMTTGTSKLKNAMKYGTKIINEDDFMNLMLEIMASDNE